MISEIFDILHSASDVVEGGNKKFNIKLNNRRVKSISAFSSNTIFYFPTIFVDQITVEEEALISKMIGTAYASFVVAAISLMPFHRIRSDDRGAVEEYLAQFHQNIGMNTGAANNIIRYVGVKANNESSAPVSDEEFAQVQNFILECWNKSRKENEDFIKIISETVSLNDMYSVDPIDPKVRYMQERFKKTQNELATWGFIGEATDDLDPESFLAYLDPNIEDDDIDDDNDYDYDKHEDDEDYANILNHINEGTVKSAIDSIKFTLETVSTNKILSCTSLTKLNSLEAKLLKLKNKYTKYLKRYKQKYEENEKNGTNRKLYIRFNNTLISNPKAFMKQYGEYIKIINNRLSAVEERRKELRSRKNIKVNETTEVNVITDLTDMDIAAVDFCDKTITEQITSPDDKIFFIREDAKDDLLQKSMDMINKLQKDYSNAQSQAKINASKADCYEQAFRRSQNLAKEYKSQLDQNKENAKQSSTQNNKHDTDGDSPNYKEAAKHGFLQHKTFDSKSIFTKMDMTRANEAVPIFAQATIGFIIDETEEVVNRDILIGVKPWCHAYPTKTIIDDIYNCIINKRKFLKFVKFITGEEKSLSDLLFGFKELRYDALDSRSPYGRWKNAFKSRKRMSKMSIPYLTKEYTPNGTLVITMNVVDYIKNEYGIDIMSPEHVKMLMDSSFLLGFVVVDQANELVNVTYDGHGYTFQQYTYAMLEREQNMTDRMYRSLYRSFATSN